VGRSLSVWPSPNMPLQRTRVAPRRSPLNGRPLGLAKRHLGLIAFVALATWSLACGGYAYEKMLVGNFGLAAGDDPELVGLVEFRDDGFSYLVQPTVFAVGWDQFHIIAKRHPVVDRGRPDKSVTELYVLTVGDRKVHGPYTDSEFSFQGQALGGSPALTFTVRLKELE